MSLGWTDDEMIDLVDLVFEDCAPDYFDGQYDWFEPHDWTFDDWHTIDEIEGELRDDWIDWIEDVGGDDWMLYPDFEEAEVEIEGELFFIVSIACRDGLGLLDDASSYIRVNAPQALAHFRARAWPQRSCTVRTIVEI